MVYVNVDFDCCCVGDVVVCWFVGVVFCCVFYCGVLGVFGY